MKSSVLVILLLAVSVAAQSYDTVTISPGALDVSVSSGEVYGTTWNSCAAVCTNQCLEEKQGTREECDKICTDKCHPQPDVITKKIPPRMVRPMPPGAVDCFGGCKQNFLQCEQGLLGANTDCRGTYEACIKKCEPAQPSCEQMCKELAVKSPENLRETYMKCVQSRCGYNCESACRGTFGEDAENCILKICRPDTEPQSCEGRCEMIRGNCKEANVDPKDCQMKIDDCKRQCKPQCPPMAGGCESKCMEGYYVCSNAGDGRDCRAWVGDCLDTCRPGRMLPPAYRCEDKCIKIESDCIDAGNSKEDCSPKTAECMKQCRPQPPSGKCEDVCIKIKGECAAAGVDDESCKMKIDACLKRCQPEEKEPNCPEKCNNRADECMKQGSDREMCMGDKAKCMRDCGQAEEPPMAAGEQREQGFFARMWASMTG